MDILALVTLCAKIIAIANERVSSFANARASVMETSQHVERLQAALKAVEERSRKRFLTQAHMDQWIFHRKCCDNALSEILNELFLISSRSTVKSFCSHILHRGTKLDAFRQQLVESVKFFEEQALWLLEDAYRPDFSSQQNTPCAPKLPAGDILSIGSESVPLGQGYQNLKL